MVTPAGYLYEKRLLLKAIEVRATGSLTHSCNAGTCHTCSASLERTESCCATMLQDTGREPTNGEELKREDVLEIKDHKACC